MTGETKPKTLYVVFRDDNGRYKELSRVEANSASAAIRQAAEKIDHQGDQPLRLAATPARSWTVVEITTEITPKYVLTLIGTAVPAELFPAA